MTLLNGCTAALKSIAIPLTTSALMLVATPGAAHNQTEIQFSSLVGNYKSEKHQTYGYFAQELVGSLNSVAAGAARWGHERLGMKDRPALQRWIYIATALNLQSRFQWATSLFFGHEYSHFATAHQFGRDTHYFRDEKTGKKISQGKAFLRSIIGGAPGGPAVSHGTLSPEQEKKHHAEKITSTTAGLNWQMNYSERWLRGHLTFGHRDVFDAPDFLLNRIYLSAYAYGDTKRMKGAKIPGAPKAKGDVAKWAAHMAQNNGVGKALDKAVLYSLGANLASPAVWATGNALARYGQTCATKLSDVYFATRFGGFTWDVPHYLNQTSMTLAPTLYWRAPKAAAQRLGADSLVLGYGQEIAVIGKSPAEHHLSLTGRWGKFTADLGLASSKAGHLIEFETAMDLTDKISVTGGAAIADGESLRGRRNFPFGNHEVWAGLKLRF